MPNRTVYLPDGIDREAKASGLNLSQILQRALRTELDKMQKMAAAQTNAERIAARLSETPTFDEAERAEGFAEGRDWAATSGTRAQIERLATMPAAWISVRTEEYGIYYDGREVDVLQRDDPWCAAFVEGVESIWDEVSPLLD